jgi:outer membrane protein TolC
MLLGSSSSNNPSHPLILTPICSITHRNTQNFMTKAEWQQPILNMDMLYMRKAAHEQTAIYALKTRRTREYLTFEVQKAYAQLQLAQQAQLVLEDALKDGEFPFSTSTQNRFEKGFLQKSDVLNVQVQVNAMERQFAEAKSNVQNASDYLSVLMDKPTGVVYTVNLIENITVVDSIETKIPENRADFQAIAIGCGGSRYDDKFREDGLPAQTQCLC